MFRHKLKVYFKVKVIFGKAVSRQTTKNTIYVHENDSSVTMDYAEQRFTMLGLIKGMIQKLFGTLSIVRNLRGRNQLYIIFVAGSQFGIFFFDEVRGQTCRNTREEVLYILAASKGPEDVSRNTLPLCWGSVSAWPLRKMCNWYTWSYDQMARKNYFRDMAASRLY